MAIWVGWVLVTLGVGLLMRFDEDTPIVTIALLPIGAGVGFGVITSALKFAGQAFASNADLPFAAGLNMFFRSLGQMFGVAVGGVVFQNSFRDQISSKPLLAANADAWSPGRNGSVSIIGSFGPRCRSSRKPWSSAMWRH